MRFRKKYLVIFFIFLFLNAFLLLNDLNFFQKKSSNIDFYLNKNQESIFLSMPSKKWTHWAKKSAVKLCKNAEKSVFYEKSSNSDPQKWLNSILKQRCKNNESWLFRGNKKKLKKINKREKMESGYPYAMYLELEIEQDSSCVIRLHFMSNLDCGSINVYTSKKIEVLDSEIEEEKGVISFMEKD